MAKKRGEGSTSEIYLTIGYIMLFGMLFLISYKYIASVAFGGEFERTYLARDTALLVSAIQASPGEIRYQYPTNLSLLKIRVNVTSRNVSAEEENGFYSKYFFPGTAGLYVQGFSFSEKISFKKNITGIYKND